MSLIGWTVSKYSVKASNGVLTIDLPHRKQALYLNIGIMKNSHEINLDIDRIPAVP